MPGARPGTAPPAPGATSATGSASVASPFARYN
jgi:hypothetical protein